MLYDFYSIDHATLLQAIVFVEDAVTVSSF